MFDKILLAIGIVIVLPTLAFLIMKWGTVGLYRGKEAMRKEDDFNVENNDNETEN